MNSFVQRAPAILIILLTISGCSQETVTIQPGVRFASSIEAFLKQDKVNPPTKGSILFIGSSIFRQWKNLNEQMAPLPVFNRAFGGSRTSDILVHMDSIVIPYAPKLIVYYCGSNDINGNEKPLDIANRFKAFWWRVNAALPETKVLYVSVNRAPQKESKWAQVDSVNTMIRDFCGCSTMLGYIDVNPILFDADMKPRLELYQDDKLHFKDTAYVEFATIMKPIIMRVWETR